MLTAFLGGGLFAPSAARAACGDYVGHDASKTTMSDQARMPTTTPHLPPVDRPPPCHGPGCSRGSLPVPATPVAPPRVQGEESAYLSSLLLVANSEFAAYLGDEDLAQPLRRGSLIYHPPR
jgi:hypothetical protein